ncbi:transposase family protein [Faecalicatena contorta]|uniref:Zinc-finger of transposase IS204/IS1001/IS1096/IS1165 n=1 Tax=Faecalicatena contorta TaxID=39482 RepID=A0A315ZTA2_9FIRM|nr:transposase family protein [Faecalicatena contorta]PWJ48108.1 transposase IS204/IS1001/IS1096/IS1165 family protein [Faecalicatena contorta]SUQ15635.1 zinc-finger of transposase IS204/IS1001/IS1096/IS1165 [Faecalicatena contorta]
MENAMVKLLDSDLECMDCKIKKDRIILAVSSSKTTVPCPYCGQASSKIHSVYQREIQDIPMHDKQTILLLNTRKMFCTNSDCAYKTFTERFRFVESHGKKTKRLIEKVLMTSTKLSSVTASILLKADSIKASKSSICDLLKKNADDCG